MGCGGGSNNEDAGSNNGVAAAAVEVEAATMEVEATAMENLVGISISKNLELLARVRVLN